MQLRHRTARFIVSIVNLTFTAAFALPGADAPAFTDGPAFKGDANGGAVSFSVSRDTDAEVSILNAEGRVVRHLAAGMLGKRAPAPFAADALKQSLRWDGLDDTGKPAAGAPFQARVRLGMTPKFEKNLGRDARTMGPISSLAVGKNGDLFVVISDSFWGRSEIRVYSREGQYLRTVLPYAASTPVERTASVGHLTVENERIPIVYNGHSQNLSPLVAGLKTQTMAVHPKGWIAMVSAPGTMADQGAPRHLLALHPEGGAPEGVSFVGPQLSPPRNFLGSAGDARARFFDHLAFSPDGEFLYLTISWLNPGEDDPRRAIKPRHSVFKVRWTDKQLVQPFLGEDGKEGDDDAHFNDPQGLATDKLGNLLVCDRGNNRVLFFSSKGKLLGRAPVSNPTQVCLNNTTNEFYVLSRTAAKNVKATELIKFAPFVDGGAKEAARVKLGEVSAVALDTEAKPPKLWCASSKKFFAVTDDGKDLTAGEPIGDNDAGLEYPMFLAADPDRNRVIVRERSDFLYCVDMKTNKISMLPVKGGLDIALDRPGNLYVMENGNTLARYTPEGKPLPFSGTGTHKLKVVFRSYGPNIGLRGHCVAANGDVYVIASTNYGKPEEMGGHIHVFGPDGLPKKENLVPGLAYGDCGIGVDVARNVYVGVNIKPEGRTMPDALTGKVSDARWIWWNKEPREAPWYYMFCNPYLFYQGSVFKFPPQGGAIYGHDICKREDPRDVPTMSAANAPAGSTPWKSSYLGRDVEVSGACWGAYGFGPIPGSSDGPTPDPGCVCFPFHLSADEFGRVFVPNCFRFCVEVLDTSGNRMMHVGTYGNADDLEEKMPFTWPAWTSVAQGKLYVSDSGNRRITIVAFEYAAEKTAKLEK